MIIPDNTNPFFAEVVRGIEDACFEKGYSVILCNSDGNNTKESNYVKLLIEKGVDGLALVSTGNDWNAQKMLRDREIAKVIVDREISGVNMDSVLVDNLKGGYQASTYLLKLGHKRIACITGPSHITPSGQRLHGYRTALKESGVPVDEKLILTGDFKSKGGYDGLKALLKCSPRPTAVFICNDMMAIGALYAAHEFGLGVPEQLSIVGFDDIAPASLTIPRLTTIAQPKHKMGEIAASMLVDRIQNKDMSTRKKLLETKLIIRDSASAPRL
jgi:LacI family transcriptional regulator